MPSTRPIALLALAVALSAAGPAAADAAVSFELSGSARAGRCSSSQPLAFSSFTNCLTKDLRVVAPGGRIRFRYTVASVSGCSTMGMIVRTTGRHYSFTQMSAAAGRTVRGSMTGNLSRIDPPRFAPPRGTILVLSVQAPFGTCSDLRSFRATVRFPTLRKAR